MMDYKSLARGAGDYYSQKLAEHGATHKGVDWSSTESQRLRFAQLLKLHSDPVQSFTINDYGCGYGALVDELIEQQYLFIYHGYDIAPAMIEQARALHGHRANVAFSSDEKALAPADYTVASGIFNVMQDVKREDWEQYVLHTLNTLWNLSERGMAFNVLTSYSDADKMRPDLYYADPRALFDYCKTHLSKQVALLHDYGLYEFTILVRK
jgi:SAM-dependent methyltransferase